MVTIKIIAETSVILVLFVYNLFGFFIVLVFILFLDDILYVLC